MSDWRAGFQTHAVKYAVIVMAVANCAGIYLAHDRLNRPYAGPGAGRSEASVKFVSAADMMTARAPEDAAPSLGIDAGPPPSALALNDGLPEIAPLPPLKVEAVPVIPSVPARAARFSLGESRAAARFHPARQTRQIDRGFDSAFTPNYSALAPYDGSSEASSLSDIHPELTAASAAEAPAEDIAVSTSEASPVEAPSAASAIEAPAAEMPAPAELPAAASEMVSELPAG